MSSFAYRVRPAVAADSATITELVRAAYAQWVPLLGREPLPMTVDYDKVVHEHRFELLFAGERLVALIETAPREGHLLILNLAIAPDLQHQGLGRRLLGHAEGVAASAGLGVVKLYTHERFERNIALYGRFGYAVERLEPGFDGQIVHMAKRLERVDAPPGGVRLCVFGDSFVQGVGDDAGLGWVGRLAIRARGQGVDLTCYDLGVRRDSSADLEARWAGEAAARLPEECERRLVFAFGVNDCWELGGAPRLDSEESLRNAAAILEWAAALCPTLVIGPLPVTADEGRDRRIEALSGRLGELCGAWGVPFFSAVPFAASILPIWRAEAQAGDGIHPNARSYAALADAIGDWVPWRTLIGP